MMNRSVLVAVALLAGAVGGVGCKQDFNASIDELAKAQEAPAAADEDGITSTNDAARVWGRGWAGGSRWEWSRGAPPAYRYEWRGRAPSANHFWMNGYHRWTGDRYVWTGGRWGVRRAGYSYIQPRYDYIDGRYRFVPGYWR